MLGLDKALGLFVNQRPNNVTIGCAVLVVLAIDAVIVVDVVVVHRATPRPDAQLLRLPATRYARLGSRGEHQRRVDLVVLRAVIVGYFFLCFFVPLCDLLGDLTHKDGQNLRFFCSSFFWKNSQCNFYFTVQIKNLFTIDKLI